MIAEDDVVWESLCIAQRVEYGLVNGMRRKKKGLQHHDDDPRFSRLPRLPCSLFFTWSVVSLCARSRSGVSGNLSAKQLYAAWYGAHAGPGGSVLRGLFGVVRCLHPPQGRYRDWPYPTR